MKVKNYGGLNFDICIKTQSKNTLINYIKSGILKKRLVLLPVDWDTNGLLCIYKGAPYDA